MRGRQVLSNPVTNIAGIKISECFSSRQLQVAIGGNTQLITQFTQIFMRYNFSNLAIQLASYSYQICQYFIAFCSQQNLTVYGDVYLESLGYLDYNIWYNELALFINIVVTLMFTYVALRCIKKYKQLTDNQLYLVSTDYTCLFILYGYSYIKLPIAIILHAVLTQNIIMLAK